MLEVLLSPQRWRLQQSLQSLMVSVKGGEGRFSFIAIELPDMTLEIFYLVSIGTFLTFSFSLPMNILNFPT